LAAAILLAGLTQYNNPHLFCIFLFFVKFFGDWSLATSWGVVTDIGGRATASVFAFNNAVAQLCLIVGSPLLGYVAKEFGWPAVFQTVAGMYIACALSWLAIDCTLPLIASRRSDHS
jgi:predicted MFS family arabinose efflux permease